MSDTTYTSFRADLRSGSKTLTMAALDHPAWATVQARLEWLMADKDPTAAVVVGARIAPLIPDARFERMSRCGHWPQFEDPPTFNALHLPFLRGGA